MQQGLLHKLVRSLPLISRELTHLGSIRLRYSRHFITIDDYELSLTE